MAQDEKEGRGWRETCRMASCRSRSCDKCAGPPGPAPSSCQVHCALPCWVERRAYPEPERPRAAPLGIRL
eukprot:1300141-Rhodomonas_salina.1